MIMKHIVTTILLAIVTLAIQAQENKFTVSGDFSGMYKEATYQKACSGIGESS